MSKAFLIDYNKCNGCYSCQIACKDEFCDQAWLPYSEAQPELGQFWCKVKDIERGRVPWVKVSYQVTLCSHCDECALMKIAPDAVYRRDDGLVIIDPEKAKGREDLVDACPAHAVYWNEALEIPQKCTGCAHLLDNGWEVPRCVDACSTDALLYVDEDEIDKDKAEVWESVSDLSPKVYYYNIPKRFIVGSVFDSVADEAEIGAEVILKTQMGEEVAKVLTDDFGDFKFDQINPDKYIVEIISDRYQPTSAKANAKDKDVVIDPVDLAKLPVKMNR